MLARLYKWERDEMDEMDELDALAALETGELDAIADEATRPTRVFYLPFPGVWQWECVEHGPSVMFTSALDCKQAREAHEAKRH